MILYELGTNAVKYGALSNAEGVVSVEWELSAKRDCLRLQWRESGGPPVQPPQRRGFGSIMIERATEGMAARHTSSSRRKASPMT